MLRRATRTHATAETAIATGHAGPAHVLVVNDDENACELLVRLLTRAGHDVDRAHNADQALAQLSVGRVDCAVLDLAAGGIGQNLKLIDTIRSSVTKSISGVRVVLIAQQGSSRLFSWQAGIDAFVARPFHANELLAQVNDTLSRPDGERERHRRQEVDAASAEAH